MDNSVILLDDDMIITFTKNNMVKVEYKQHTGTSIKYLTYSDFVKTVIASSTDAKENKVIAYESPLMPNIYEDGIITLQYKECTDGAKYAVLIREALPFDFEFKGITYKNVGVPKLLFCIKTFNNAIRDVWITAVKDRYITNQTELYKYPFSNIFSHMGRVCFGQNDITKIIDAMDFQDIKSIVNIFLSMPNTGHSYGLNDYNLTYGDLLTELQNKKFDNNKLLDAQMTYEKWFNEIL